MSLNSAVNNPLSHTRSSNLDHGDLIPSELVPPHVHGVGRLEDEQTSLVNLQSRLGHILHHGVKLGQLAT